jgi:hypothetical protein
MFRSQRGSAAAWVVLVLILLVTAAAVLYLTVFKDDDEKAGGSSTGDAAVTQSQQNQDNAAGQGGTGTGTGTGTDTGAGQGSGQGSGQVTPGSNVREPVTVVAPPIESGEEAYLAVKGASPEVLDWYWAVDDPRYEATDSGSYYVVRLYSAVPAEGNSPEHQADFGRYRVEKQTGTVSEITK